MISKNKTALLVGATGLVGNELLHILLNKADYTEIYIFTRNTINIEHPKLKQIVINFEEMHRYKEYIQVNDVYCCLGTTIKKAGSQQAFRKVDFEYPLILAKLAKECGAEKFLMITAMGSDKKSKVFYSRVKGEVEEAIKMVALPSLYFFQPSLLLGDRKEFRLGEKVASILSPIFSFFLIGSLKKYKPIYSYDVAQAMYETGKNGVTGVHTYHSGQIQALSDKQKDI